jgi:hypothetical protein
MVFDEETGEIVANRMIASTLLTNEAREYLKSVEPETRIAMEALIADGLIEEREGKFFPTPTGIKIIEKLDEWLDEK